MKIEYLKTYENELGRGRKGVVAHVSNELGKKLVKRKLAKQIDEERIQVEASYKDAPIRKLIEVELPEEAENIEPPAEEEKPFWAKIFRK